MTPDPFGTRGRLVAIPAGALALVLGSAALERLGTAAPREPLLGDALLDAEARTRPPGEALILGRALPIASATAADWQLLPGIGPRTAAAIVAARPRTLADVAAIRGVGAAREAMLARVVREE